MNGSMTVGPKPRPSSRKNWLLVLVAAIALLVVATPTASQATTLPPGNSAQQWNTIAQDTVVNTPGIFQNEALLYMAYVQAAVYDAVASIQGGYQPYGPNIAAPAGASADAAVVEAAYRTLTYYFPAQAATLDSFYAEALGLQESPGAETHGNGLRSVKRSTTATNRMGGQQGWNQLSQFGTGFRKTN
jgi:hypothetical protein